MQIAELQNDITVKGMKCTQEFITDIVSWQLTA